jgi:uncharacterized Zn finger protein
MIKVLAAELSDQGRLSRGKRYWADDAVVDIVIGHGAVTAEVQGGRPDPYVVTIEAEGGSGVPSKREIWIQCTCPDDTGAGNEACKHAVAAMFALSDEIAIDPTLVDRWRASRRGDRSNVTDLPAPVPPDDTEERERPAEVIPLRRTWRDEVESARDAEPPEPEPEPDPEIDEIGRLLASPTGMTAPELPVPEPLRHPPLSSRLLTDVLEDALDHLAIRWE